MMCWQRRASCVLVSVNVFLRQQLPWEPEVKKGRKLNLQLSLQLCAGEALDGGRFPCWVSPSIGLMRVTWIWS